MLGREKNHRYIQQSRLVRYGLGSKIKLSGECPENEEEAS